MAPSNDSARNRKSTPANRPVRPAIPLTFVKRQAAAAAAASAAANTSNTPGTSKPPRSSASKAQNASSGVEHSGAGNATATSRQITVLPQVNGRRASTHSDAEIRIPKSKKETLTSASQHNIVQAATPSDSSHSSAGLRHTETPVSNSSLKTTTNVAAEKPLTRPPPTSVSLARGTMHPPSKPARLDSAVNGGYSNGGPGLANLNGRPSMHQARQSNSGLRFGALNDSPSASPAPPHSAGFPPPPGMSFRNGQPPFILPHAINNFPPPMTNGPERMASATSFDHHGRPFVAYAPVDSYPQYSLPPSTFVPSTPQSLHGSQASAHPEDGGAYQQHHVGIQHNDAPGSTNHMVPPNHPGPMTGGSVQPGPMPLHAAPSGFPSTGGHAPSLQGFIQEAWSTGKYVDCMLEIRLPAGPPVRFPAHHMVLAQSPLLEKLLFEQGQDPLPYSVSLRPPFTLFLSTDEPWARPDALELALRHMYGYPLLPETRFSTEATPFAGSHSERFNFALSYMVSGLVLGWNPAVKRGGEIAAHLVSIETLETAMQFALDGHVDKGSFVEFKYGDASKALLHKIVELVSNLTPTIHLNTMVTCSSQKFARLPYDSPPPSESSTVEIRGNATAHLKGDSQSQRPLHIRFGDLTTSSEEEEGSSETLDGSYQPTSDVVLSRVLLNLPFAYLKMFIECGPEEGLETRCRVVQEVIREREARRLRGLNAVIGKKVPGAQMAEATLQRPEPQGYTKWEVLGWREELSSSTGCPTIARQWSPLRVAQKVGAAYP